MADQIPAAPTQSAVPAAGNTAPVAPSPGSGTPAAAPPADWISQLEPDQRGLVELKKWTQPSDLVKAYQGAEKLIGTSIERRLIIPAEGADQKEWDALYNRLGRPETPEGYKLPIPEGDSGEFAKQISPVFHSIGITQTQAAKLGEWWNGWARGLEESMAREAAQTQQVELQQLRQEWGGAYDQRIELGRRAAREFGIDESMMNGIEESVGTARFLKMMANIGERVGESQYRDGDGSGNNGTFGMTPDAARARIKELMSDREWGAKYLKNPEGPEARELNRLNQIAVTGGR